jgi:AcrR family transcriptional regulator
VKAVNGSPNRRQQILEEATHLFAAKGFEGSSMRTIARACGITEAAIYRHFASKNDLYEQVIIAKAVQHNIAGQLEGFSTDGNIEQVLRAIAEHILAMAKQDPELMRLMVNNSLERGSSVARVLFKEVRLPYINYMSRELTRRVANGEIRAIDPLITSRCFVGMVMDCALNLGVWNRLAGLDIQADDVVCNNVPIFALGLSKEFESENPLTQPGRA